MAFIAVPDVAQVEMVYNWNGQKVQNVLHYYFPTGYNAALLNNLAVAVKDKWIAQLKAEMATQISLIEVKAIDLSDINGPTATISSGLPSAGTKAGTTMPNNVTCVITKRTALRGRSFRGRIYMPGLIFQQTNLNDLAAGVGATLVTKWSTFMTVTDALANDHVLGVISRYTNNAPRATGIFTLVTHMTTGGVLDSLRRRLPGRGQ